MCLLGPSIHSSSSVACFWTPYTILVRALPFSISELVGRDRNSPKPFCPGLSFCAIWTILWPRFASSWRFSYTEVAEGSAGQAPGGKQDEGAYIDVVSFLNSRTSNSASSSHLAMSNRKPGLRLQNTRRPTELLGCAVLRDDI